MVMCDVLCSVARCGVVRLGRWPPTARCCRPACPSPVIARRGGHGSLACVDNLLRTWGTNSTLLGRRKQAEIMGRTQSRPPHRGRALLSLETVWSRQDERFSVQETVWSRQDTHSSVRRPARANRTRTAQSKRPSGADRTRTAQSGGRLEQKGRALLSPRDRLEQTGRVQLSPETG